MEPKVGVDRQQVCFAWGRREVGVQKTNFARPTGREQRQWSTWLSMQQPETAACQRRTLHHDVVKGLHGLLWAGVEILIIAVL